MATTIDWGSVNSVVVKDGDGNTLGTDPEIWCNGYKQWPVDIPVAAPYQTGQTGGISSGIASFNIGLSTAGVSSIANHVASDTSTHYATITIADGYCWADGYASKSRQVAYALKKTSTSFYLKSGSSTTYCTVSGFSSDGKYDWEDAIDNGAVSGFTYLNYVTTNSGMSLRDPSGEKVTKWDIITSGTYTVVKNTQTLYASLSFSNGLFSVSTSGSYRGALSYEWKWSNGTVMNGSTGPTWYADIYYFPDMQMGSLKVTVTAAETDAYEAATATCYMTILCLAGGTRIQASASTLKQRVVGIDGTTYCVWTMSSTTRSTPYTRYAVRRSSSASESSWGSSTYWRQYFVPYASFFNTEWTTMKHKKYSSGSFTYGGYTTGAWYNCYGPDASGVNIWVTADSGYYYNMAAVTTGASDPS